MEITKKYYWNIFIYSRKNVELRTKKWKNNMKIKWIGNDKFGKWRKVIQRNIVNYKNIRWWQLDSYMEEIIL